MDKKKQKILSFREFISREDGFDRYNNIIAFWMKGDRILTAAYRGTPHCLKFRRENPDLDAILCDAIKNRTTNPLALGTKKQLYRAYKIMKGYGLSDEQLFT